MIMIRRLAVLGVSGAMLGWSLVAVLPAPAQAQASRAIADFNFDGFDDLVIASPLEDVGSAQEAGVVRIFYGGDDGPGSGGVQTINQKSGNLGSTAEAGDHFGGAIAVGDLLFGVGSELVIGVPGEDINVVDAGAVDLLHFAGSQFDSVRRLHQDETLVE